MAGESHIIHVDFPTCQVQTTQTTLGWQQVQIARWTMGQLQVAKLEVIFFLRY